jgi:photosystem II stability/assembly factor-like uncharacterized protein
MKKLLLIIGLAILSNINGNAQFWTLQNPIPTSNHLFSASFPDINTGYFVGNSGTIIKTTNGGNNWIALSSGTTVDFNSVNFTDANTGYVLGNRGTILKTTNGGSSWLTQIIGVSNQFESAFFTDANTGYSVGYFGKILKTTNAGTNWIEQISGTTSYLQSVYFINANTGFAVGGVFLKTTDGGTNWALQSNITGRAIFFKDVNNGFIVGENGTLQKTTNGGINWTTQPIGVTDNLYSIQFADMNTGYIVGTHGRILKTTNGGTNWSSTSTGTSCYFFSLSVIDANTVYAGGSGGYILKTTNGGINWQTQTSILCDELFSVYFTDSQTGYSVGDNGTIIKTTNGGKKWKSQTSGTTFNLRSVYFTDTNTGFIVGQEGIILKTTNGGTNWIKLPFVSDIDYSSIFFTDANTAYAFGGDGLARIVKTTNAGLNWTSVGPGYSEYVHSVFFTDVNTGYAAADDFNFDHLIFKTTNGGTNWTELLNSPSGPFYSLFFIDANTGFAAGPLTTIFKTTNGGTDWSYIPTGISNSLMSIYFTDKNTGYAVGMSGSIIKTTNGGLNWEKQTSNVNNYLHSTFFIPQSETQIGYAAGGFGLIIQHREFLNKIKGTIYNDVNNNSIKDPFENGIANAVIKYEGNNNAADYYITDSTGNYILQCDSGNYKVTISKMPKYGLNSPANYIGVFNGNFLTDSTKDFAIHYLPNIKDLEVKITPLRPFVRIGREVSYQIDYINSGTDTIDGFIEMNFDNKLNYLNSIPDYNTILPNKLLWNYINLKPLERKIISINFTVSNTAHLYDTIFNNVNINPIINDTTPLNNTDSNYQIIRGSYDPNEKEVFPKRNILVQEVVNGTDLEYTIRFQNTGNDTAFTVRIIDKISPYLNISGIEVLSSSHNYTWKLNSSNEIEWTFPNILLPDSTTNEAGSHGFIKFKIPLKNSVAEGDVIKNKADIYFDYNIPVITNEVKTYIVNSLNLPANAGSISGNTSVCKGQNLVSYSVPTIPYATSYIWTLPDGASGSSVTNNISVDYSSTSISGNITVKGRNLNGDGSISSLAITVNQQPENANNITGITSVCQGQNNVTYTVPEITNATSYLWTIPNGATGTSNTNTITVNFGTTAVSGDITVKGNNACGDGGISTLAITVNPLPSNAGNISGSTAVCQGQNNVTYTVPAILNATSYIWTLPMGATGTSTTNSITVDFGTSAVSGNITVKGNNSCGDGGISSLTITVNVIPATPVITQDLSTLTSNAPAGNQWYLNGSMIPGATSQSHTCIVNGDYFDIVTLNGCSSDTSNIINVTNVGIEFTENNKIFKIYPNPVNDELIIEINGTKENTNFEILNSIGQLVFKGNLLEKTVVNTTTFSPGVYLIKFENGKTFEFKKMVKE